MRHDHPFSGPERGIMTPRYLRTLVNLLIVLALGAGFL